MSIYRSGEKGTPLPRSQRFIKKESGKWCFYSREGFELGPYDSCLEAQEGLKTYLEFIDTATPEVLSKFFNTYAA